MFQFCNYRGKYQAKTFLAADDCQIVNYRLA